MGCISSRNTRRFTIVRDPCCFCCIDCQDGGMWPEYDQPSCCPCLCKGVPETINRSNWRAVCSDTNRLRRIVTKDRVHWAFTVYNVSPGDDVPSSGQHPSACSVIHLTAMAGNREGLAFLFDIGGSPNCQTQNGPVPGFTVLELAVAKKHIECVQECLDAGSDQHSIRTALQRAEQWQLSTDMIALLQKHVVQ